jgi:hypothetical protein
MKVRPILILIFLYMAWVQSHAQSTDPDHPTVLREGQLTITASNEAKNYYFSFTALGGEVKLTGDGLGETNGFWIYLQNVDFQNIGSGHFNIRIPSERTVLRTDVKKAQTIIVKIETRLTRQNEKGTLKLRIEGAAQFNGNAIASNTEPPPAKEPESDVSSGRSKRVIIRLKNGQTVEGKYNGMSITSILNSKLSLTMRGKDLPQFNTDDVKSITIERD